METGKKDTVGLAKTVSYHDAISEFQLESCADQARGTSSSFSASGGNSAVGRPQWPSSVASVSA